MRFATKAIRVGQDPDALTRAVTPPIHPSTTFTFKEIGKAGQYEYIRTANPTRAALEQCVASLEEGEYGMAFASGSAATDAALSILKQGDHVVSSDQIYGGTLRIFESLCKPRGITVTYVNPEEPANFERAFTDKTKLVWIETPSNPLLTLTDIEAVAALTHARGILLAADNTFATPYFQRPLTLGADIVVHSTTKYINGHSDVLGGIVITNQPDLNEKIRFYQNAIGAVLGPFDSWLTMRGVRTLAARMRQHEANALRIAEFLKLHPYVEKVIYPGLPDHPQHELAKRQMSGFGAIVTLRIKGGLESANRFVKSMRIFMFAESLGGVESLVGHSATMSHAGMTEEERQAIGITQGTLRLSVGIEDIEDLIEDLGRGLKATHHRGD